ncbi:hypothetical protein Tco_0200329 [Tanacetum coccineum]
MYLNLWSYKVVRHRYSNFMIQPEPKGSTQGYPLDSVEVLRYHTKGEKVRIGNNADCDGANTGINPTRFYTLAGNPVKEILLKLNLPDHRILKDGGEDDYLLRYEVGESSTAAPRPTGGHRADYGFIDTMYVEIRRQRAKEVGYGIRDIWVDRTEAVLRRIDRLSYFRVLMDWSRIDSFTMRLHDCWIGRPSFPRGWDIPLEYRCDIDSHRIYHYKGTLVAALGQIQALQARDQTHADDPEGAGSSA